MTQLEYAQEFFGYDPDATPQLELNHARRSLREAEIRSKSDKEILAELDDDAVYEWWFYSEHNIYVPRKREIVRRTHRQIRLAPRHRGDKQTFLPRQQLEAGEIVRHGKGWGGSDYVLGWVVRPKLKEQSVQSARWLEGSRNELQRVELAIINNELFVTPGQQQLIELFMELDRLPKQSDEPKVNWQKEGF